jgi:HlyD family secretion protein
MKSFQIFFLCVLLVLVAGCAPDATSTPESNELDLTIDQYLQPERWVEGIVDIKDRTLLSFQISGEMKELLVEEGDVVSSGDLLAVLNNYQLEVNEQRAEVALDIAEANLADVKSGVHPALISEAESVVERVTAQPAVGVAQQDVQEADIKAAQARLDYLLDQPFPEDVAIAEANVENAKMDLLEAQTLLEESQLFAPLEGTIIQVFVNNFEYIGAGDPIVQIGNPDNLIIRSQIEDMDIGGIDVGDVLEITFGALPGVEVKGKVISILPALGTSNPGVFTVLIEPEEIPAGVRWGVTAQVHIP